METHQVGPYTVTVAQDYHHDEQPFEWLDDTTFGIDMSNHRDYSSPTYGDDMPVTMGDWMEWSQGDREDCEDRQECHRFSLAYYILPVYMYDHSGRTVSTSPFSCRWDSGMAGFVYVKKSEFANSTIGGVKPGMSSKKRQELAEKYLRGQVEHLDDLMTGNIWCYKIEDEDGDEVESCYGYVGDAKYCEEEALSQAQYILKSDRKSRIKRLKQMIKFRSPLHVRANIVGARP